MSHQKSRLKEKKPPKKKRPQSLLEQIITTSQNPNNPSGKCRSSSQLSPALSLQLLPATLGPRKQKLRKEERDKRQIK